MDESKPNMVIFGAGMTGRGQVAQLAYESGWNITFIDKNSKLIDTLNHSGSYVVRLLSEHPRDITISGYKAFKLEDNLDIAESIAKSDMVITSVLPNNLSGVAPVLAEGLRLRLADGAEKPLNIIAAENMNNGSSTLWTLTSRYLSFQEQQRYGFSYSFPNSMIARVVPRSSDPLVIVAEDYNEWTADLNSRVGTPPEINGLEWVNNQEARLKRKLYIHNTGHAVCAYLGILKGYKFIHESACDSWIFSCIKKSMEESGRAVAKEYGFDEFEIKGYAENLLKRLSMDMLPDSIDRVVREPIRKLNINDRFLGPLMLCEKYNIQRDGICMGIAGLLAAEIKDDEGSRLTAIIREKGPINAIKEVSGYVPDYESSKLISEQYTYLKSIKHSS